MLIMKGNKARAAALEATEEEDDESSLEGDEDEDKDDDSRTPATDPKGKGKAELKRGETLMRKAEDIQRRLDAIVEGNDGLKRFVNTCMYSQTRRASLFTVAQMISMHSTLPLPSGTSFQLVNLRTSVSRDFDEALRAKDSSADISILQSVDDALMDDEAEAAREVALLKESVEKYRDSMSANPWIQSLVAAL